MIAKKTKEVTIPDYLQKDSLWEKLNAYLQQDTVIGYLLISPALTLLLILVAYPFFIALYFSVSNTMVGVPGSFVGLRNFFKLLQDDIFLQTLQNSFVFTGISVFFKTILGLVLALLLNQKLRFKRFIRGAVLLPFVIPTALSTLGWWWMFDSLYSVVNWTLYHLGLIRSTSELNWLGTPYLAMAAVIIVNVWRGLPFFAISILAGLVAIPQELYEAAETDGAGKVNRFFYITLPLLRPVLVIVVLFSTIFTLSDFNIVYVLTRGGPVNSTHLLATLSNQVGLVSGNIGEGAAISLFLFPILVMTVYFQLKMIRKE
jgi:multiple sugar transport system permease protein